MELINFLNRTSKILLFALPISASSLINMISSFLGMTMVAQLGKLELAAGALAIATFVPIMTIVSTLFYALGILISHYDGQKKSKIEIGTLVTNCFILAFLLSIPSTLILWNLDKLLFLFKQDPILIKITKNYFHFAALFLIPCLCNMVVSQFYSGIGKPQFTMIISAISCPLTFVLSYGFILGHFGLPKLGLAGLSLSMLIVQLFLLGVTFFWMLTSTRIKQYHIFSGKIDLIVCKNIFCLGFPIGIQFCGELSAIALVTYFMGYCGITALAATQIISQYYMLMIMIILGIAQALSLLVSRSHGKQEIYLIKSYLISALSILLVIVVFAIFIVAIFPLNLMSIFINVHNLANQPLIHLTCTLFFLAVLLLLVDGARQFFSACLRGVQDSKIPMLIGISCLWLFSIPLSYILGFIFHRGPVGLRVGFTIGFVLASFLLWRRLQKQLKLFEQYFSVPEYLVPHNIN